MFIALLLLGVLLGYFLYKEIGKSPNESDLAAFEHLSYFKDGQFISSKEQIADISNVSNGPFSWWDFLFGSKHAPKSALPMKKLNASDFSANASNFALYWLGHSNVLAEFNGLRVLIDPVFDNAAPIPFAVRRYTPAPIERKALPMLDIIVITHNHYDHLERKSIQQLNARHFIVPLGLKRTLVGWGVDAEKITELGWGDEVEISGLKIIAQTGTHFSTRSLLDRNKTLWNSYIFAFGGKKIFLSGDSGYDEHFARIGEQYGPFDVALMEIDGWNSGWKNTHMTPSEVIRATKDLRAKALLPVHWAVFDLALHPWHESIDMIMSLKEDIKVLTPLMGERIEEHSTTKEWWKGIE